MIATETTEDTEGKNTRCSLGTLWQIKIPEKDVEKVLKLELSFALYQRGIISLGKARKLAGMSKWEFIEELGKRKIERHYTEKELEEDLAFAKILREEKG